MTTIFRATGLYHEEYCERILLQTSPPDHEESHAPEASCQQSDVSALKKEPAEEKENAPVSVIPTAAADCGRRSIRIAKMQVQNTPSCKMSATQNAAEVPSSPESRVQQQWTP
jgi:hypothetical protein